MPMHPWDRIRTHIAGTLGLMMGAYGITIASLKIENQIFRTISLTLSAMTFVALTALFTTLIYLTARDYYNQYNGYEKTLFGVSWLRY